MTSDSERYHLRDLARPPPPLAGARDRRSLFSVGLRRRRQKTIICASAAATSRAKRLVDIFLSLAALLAFLPLLLLIALLVRQSLGAPVIYRQPRGGLLGKTFVIYKFRTMTATDGGEGVRHATKDDPRVAKVGAFLRRSSLDELPQLFNILKGEMSIVGPRPHALVHDEYYSTHIPAYRARMSAKPGLTGLAQISGHRGEISNVEAMADRVACDLEYIQSWSLLFDLKLIFFTLVRFLFDPRAY